MKEITKISQIQFMKGLEAGKNMLVFGKSGTGKTSIVDEFAAAHDLKILDYDLAGRLPEEVSGIPAITPDGNYYKKAMNEDTLDFFEKQGKGYILRFDEVNQANPDTLNALYSISHPNPAMRRWGNHPIPYCQVVALGNLSDGTDGTVYLTDLPTPLMNRFFVFELVSNDEESAKYLARKYKNITSVQKYIKAMQKEGISPRDMDIALDILQYEYDPMFLEAKLGGALTAKLYDIQKGIKSIDPSEKLRNCKTAYKAFKDNSDTILWAGETVTDEADLLDRFRDIGLTEEEIASIIKA